MMEVLDTSTDNYDFNTIEVYESGIGWIPTSFDDLCEADYVKAPVVGESAWGVFQVNRDRDLAFIGWGIN